MGHSFLFFSSVTCVSALLPNSVDLYVDTMSRSDSLVNGGGSTDSPYQIRRVQNRKVHAACSLIGDFVSAT